MFHKENSSIEEVAVLKNNNETTSNNKKLIGGSNNKKNTKNTTSSNNSKQKQQPQQHIKGKDVPVRKSDRRILLKHATDYFLMGKQIQDAIFDESITLNDKDRNNNNQHQIDDTDNDKVKVIDGDDVVENAMSSTVDSFPATCIANEEEVDEPNIGTEKMESVIRRVLSMLRSAFLMGDIYYRQLRLTDGTKVKLYFRSPSEKDQSKNKTKHNNNNKHNDNNATITDIDNDNDCQKIDIWPYTQSDQCVLIFVDFGSNVNTDQYYIPSIALVSVIIPQIILLSNYSSINEFEQAIETGNATTTDMSLLYDILPTVQLHPHVSKYIARGANLMKAGMRSIPEYALSPSSSSSTNTMFPQVAKQSISDKLGITSSRRRIVVMVCIQGNVQPFAIGLLESNIRSMSDIGIGTTGMGVTIVSSYGDDIWKRQLLQQKEYKLQNRKTLLKSATNQQQDTINMKYFNLIGGAYYDDGHYGNVGFVDGTMVVPITSVGDDDDDNNDDDDTDVSETESIDKTNNGNVVLRDSSSTALVDNITIEGINLNPDYNIQHNNQQITDGKTLSSTFEAATVDNAVSETIDTNTLSGSILEVQQQEGAEEEGDDNNIQSDDNEDEENEELSQDDILHLSVLAGLLKINPTKKQLLPMTIANFYANYVLPNRPPNTTIQLKQTRYKKFSTYVAEQSLKSNTNSISTEDATNRPLLTVGPDPSKKKGPTSDPMAMLIDFHKGHVDFRWYQQEIQKQNQQNGGNNIATGSNSAGSCRQVLLDLFIVPQHFIDLLRLDKDAVKAVNASTEERKNTGFLTSKEVKEILDQYIEREQLVRSDFSIQLDGPLSDVLYGKKGKNKNGDNSGTKVPETLSQKDIAAKWKSRMEPAYALVAAASSTNTNTILRLGRGVAPTVQVEVGKAKVNNKLITRVRGTELYGVSPSILAKDIATRFACSAIVDEHPETKGRPALRKASNETGEIIIQGNFGDEIMALLYSDPTLSEHGGAARDSEYYFPKNSIVVTYKNGIVGKSKNKKKK